MLPHFHVLGIHVPMYSVMLVIGLLLFTLLYFYYFLKTYRMDRVTFNRLTFSVCISIAALGIFAFLFDGLFHSIEEGKLAFGGITWLGGVAGAFPAALISIHLLVPKKKGYELDILDSLMPGLAIAHAFGRVGCFFGGCCFGKVTSSPFGVSFPEGSPAAKLHPDGVTGASLPVLPTQLFEAVFEAALFLALFFISKRTKKYNTAIWSISYGVFRFSLEFLRGDDRGSTGLILSPAQILSIILVIFGVLIILLRKKILLRSLDNKLAVWQADADSFPIVPYNTVKGKLSDTELLCELYKLKEEGVITEEEYEKKKNEILERM